jgi:hypothetical protein
VTCATKRRGGERDGPHLLRGRTRRCWFERRTSRRGVHDGAEVDDEQWLRFQRDTHIVVLPERIDEVPNGRATHYFRNGRARPLLQQV